MKDSAPQSLSANATRLADYQPYPFALDHVDLTFHLDPMATKVISRLSLRPLQAGAPLRLDGEGLTLIALSLNGTPLPQEAYRLDEISLTILPEFLPKDPFVLEIEVTNAPAQNTALEGLYMSRGMYCTQCEAEGFRKITYFPDRPDVMARFDVRIHADLPVLLSNGNPQAQGTGFAHWHDPWPKPAYLFALVAGDLVAESDRFTTCEGREVALNIYVRQGDAGLSSYAMDALKRSMAWDERVYGRAYDLDVFNIVAVDDFNMGAMENKGLNIFNSKFVLASPQTATDQDYAFIERIIAHEYFHNWTGNRITCRDWFQLCLKEGLTVYRDQQFSADARSPAVQRIGDVLTLRARQFREDAGPLAHPVRPETYVEINNFYTATVYEKGAEVIGMLHRLVGNVAYRAALDLYFTRHDGQACTIEDWLRVFADVTGRDLSQFLLWYRQSGTPRLTISEEWSPEAGRLRLHLTQVTPPTQDQAEKAPLVIPVALGLIGPDGAEMRPTQVIEMTAPQMEVVFDDLPARPVVSALRGFSAPVILDMAQDRATRAHLFAHDTDPFARWEAGRALARDGLVEMILENRPPCAAYLDALGNILTDPRIDPEFRALCAALPSEDSLAQSLFDGGTTPDPWVIWQARRDLEAAIGAQFAPIWEAIYDDMAQSGPYRAQADDAGKRALRNCALRYLTRVEGAARAQAHYRDAGNMTDQLAAFGARLDAGDGAAAAEFALQWGENRLVMDKWFTLQLTHAAPKDAVALARDLAAHPDFNWKNPNRFRALIGGLTAGNPAGFHDPSGEGYRFVAEWLLRMDGANPQTAARMSSAFDTWRRYDADRQGMICAALDEIKAHRGLSRDLGEMVARMRG